MCRERVTQWPREEGTRVFQRNVGDFIKVRPPPSLWIIVGRTAKRSGHLASRYTMTQALAGKPRGQLIATQPTVGDGGLGNKN